MRFKNLSAHKEIVHFQTTRKGGSSIGELGEMNTSYSVGDDPVTVLKNRNKIATELGVPLDRFVFPKQCHTANIAVVGENDCGRGVYFERHDPVANTDALITNTKNVMLCIKTADCIPVLLYDPIKCVVAAIHAGWRGTAAGISRKTAVLMHEQFGCRAEDIIAGIGAGAGFCCYETNEEFYDKIASTVINYGDYRANNRHIDLKEINRLQLIETGLRPNNIEVNDICTICNSDLHFSHRGSGGHAGRSLNGICLL